MQLFAALVRLFKLNNISVKHKLLLIYLLCVLMPIIITDSWFYEYTKAQVKKQQLQQCQVSLERLSLMINKEFEDAIYIAYSIMTDRRLNDCLERQYRSLDDFYDMYDAYMRDALQGNIYMKDQINSITIYTSNTTIPESMGYRHLPLDAQASGWYAYAIDEPYRFSIISYYEGGERYVSLIKDLNYYKGSNIQKILKIDFKHSRMIDILRSEKQVGEIYLVDAFNNVIYSTDDKYNNGFYKFDEVPVSSTDHIIEQNLDKSISLGLWKVVEIAGDDEIAAAIKAPGGLILMLALLNVALASVIIWVISISIERRLSIINSHIQKVRHQDFDVIKCDEGNDEIGELIREFNRMATTIQRLIEDVYKSNLQKQHAEIEKKQAMINALQSQINPHFLFNTLESIRMRSVMKGEVETAQVIKYLSKLFRRVLAWGSDRVTVREELDYIKYFLEIQKYRFGDKLSYELDAEPEVLDCMIPKMVIQPFVENACVHGIEGSDSNGMVRVEVKKIGHAIQFTVEDNGVGMDAQTLESVYRSLEDQNYAADNVGIRNAYNRLKLFYPDGFDIAIQSHEGVGTSITIKIRENCSKDVLGGEV